MEALPPATSFELGTSASLGVTSDQYGSMQAGTRDIRYNPSLTDPAHYIGGPGNCVVSCVLYVEVGQLSNCLEEID